jgi:hypothetical protein
VKTLCIAVILAGLVTVSPTFAKDDAPAEGHKVAKKSKSAEKKGGAEHKGGKDAKAGNDKKAPAK